jgi:hypothetical protein
MRIPPTLRCLVLAVVPVLACSSNSNPGGTGGSAGSGGSGGTAGGGGGGSGGVGVAPPDGGGGITNPYGVPYPTENIGIIARSGTSAGSTPGNVISNFHFLGYISTDPGTPTSDKGSPTVINLSDFYDPAEKKYKVLHLNVAARWCAPCNDEADELTGSPPFGTGGGSVMTGLAQDGVAVFSLLTEGTTMGTPATVSDLQAWVTGKGVDYDMGIDPEQAMLGVFFTGAEIPWNADVDARTMEILEQGEGVSPTFLQDIEGWATWVEQNKPSYGCPTGYTLNSKTNACDAS